MLGLLQLSCLLADTSISLIGLALGLTLLPLAYGYDFIANKMGYTSQLSDRVISGLRRNIASVASGLKHSARAILGLWDPCYLAHDLLLHDKSLAISGGGLYKTNIKILYPQNALELRTIIKNARLDERKVVVKGAGLSQGQQFLSYNPAQVVIDLSHMKMLEIVEKMVKNS